MIHTSKIRYCTTNTDQVPCYGLPSMPLLPVPFLTRSASSGIDGGWESVALEMLTGKPSLCIQISPDLGGGSFGRIRWNECS